jgi:hypothetical protein
MLDSSIYKIILLLNRLEIISGNDNRYSGLIVEAVSLSNIHDALAIQQLKLWQKHMKNGLKKNASK